MNFRTLNSTHGMAGEAHHEAATVVATGFSSNQVLLELK